VVRHYDGDSAHGAARLESLVDPWLADVDAQMWPAQILRRRLGARRAARERMICSYDAHKPIGEKVLAAVSLGCGAAVDHQVERAGVELVERHRAEGFTRDRRLWRLHQDRLNQRRAKGGDGVVADGETKRMRRGGDREKIAHGNAERLLRIS
jgi:hypothetical protein